MEYAHLRPNFKTSENFHMQQKCDQDQRRCSHSMMKG